MMYPTRRLFHVKIWMTQVSSDDEEDEEHVVVCDSRTGLYPPSYSNSPDVVEGVNTVKNIQKLQRRHQFRDLKFNKNGDYSTSSCTSNIQETVEYIDTEEDLRLFCGDVNNNKCLQYDVEDYVYVENSNYDGDTSEGYETLDDFNYTFVSNPLYCCKSKILLL